MEAALYKYRLVTHTSFCTSYGHVMCNKLCLHVLVYASLGTAHYE